MFAANRRRSLSSLSVLVTEMATKYMDCSGFRITFPKQSARSPPNLVTKLKKKCNRQYNSLLWYYYLTFFGLSVFLFSIFTSYGKFSYKACDKKYGNQKKANPTWEIVKI